jgi:uncharacterized protein YacL
MELFILLLGMATFAETSVLLFKRLRPRGGGKRKIYVDTSALIDGRVLNIAKSGFIIGDLIILKSVLRELQLLADGKDSEKRSRAREGLKLATDLERIEDVNTEIVDDGTGRKQVDEELLKYAKENNGYILTLDYNLIKVAEAEGTKTLNINDLALALRNEFLPGETMRLKIQDKGSGKGQGIGHLSDGTMVVVDGADRNIGQEMTVEFVRFFETSAGKMIFARPVKTKRKK